MHVQDFVWARAGARAAFLSAHVPLVSAARAPSQTAMNEVAYGINQG